MERFRLKEQILCLALIRLLQEIPDLFAGSRLPEKTAEIVILEMFGDRFESAEVITRPIGGRDQQEQDKDVPAVEAFKIETFVTDGDGGDNRFGGRVLRVGHGHTATDAG